VTKIKKKTLAPPCLGEALRRGTLAENDNFGSKEILSLSIFE
jgi:hypothetical protein